MREERRGRPRRRGRVRGRRHRPRRAARPAGARPRRRLPRAGARRAGARRPRRATPSSRSRRSSAAGGSCSTGGRTVDFTPLQGGSIEADLAARDFTINAMAVPLAGGETIDPSRRTGRPRAPRASRRLRERVRRRPAAPAARRPARGRARLPARPGRRGARPREGRARRRRPAGERILDELPRLSAGGYERLAELGLLEPLGGPLIPRLRAFDSPWFRLAVTFGPNLRQLPDLERPAPLPRHAAAGRGARRTTRRARSTASAGDGAVRRSRRSPSSARPGSGRRSSGRGGSEPAEPLLRGDELGLPPGPEVGRLLELIAEERAAGTISTREEALELVRRSLE